MFDQAHIELHNKVYEDVSLVLHCLAINIDFTNPPEPDEEPKYPDYGERILDMLDAKLDDETHGDYTAWNLIHDIAREIIQIRKEEGIK